MEVTQNLRFYMETNPLSRPPSDHTTYPGNNSLRNEIESILPDISSLGRLDHATVLVIRVGHVQPPLSLVNTRGPDASTDTWEWTVFLNVNTPQQNTGTKQLTKETVFGS